MTVDQPGADHHQGPGLDMPPGDLVRPGGDAGIERGRRIEPHGFQQHLAQARPAADVGQGLDLSGGKGAHLLAQAGLLLRRQGQQVTGPEQHPGGGLEPRCDEGRGLVLQGLVAERGAGVRITRGHQQVEQVLAALALAVQMGAAGGDDAADLHRPAAAE